VLLEVDTLVTRLRQTVDAVHNEMEAVQIVQYRHVEGCGYGTLFLVPSDVDVFVVCAPVGKPVDQPWVGMNAKITGLSLVNILSKSVSPSPCGCSDLRLQLH